MAYVTAIRRDQPEQWHKIHFATSSNNSLYFGDGARETHSYYKLLKHKLVSSLPNHVLSDNLKTS